MKLTAKTIAAAACVSACLLLTACGGQNSDASQTTGTETTAATGAETTAKKAASTAASDNTGASAASSAQNSAASAASNKQSTTAGSSDKNASAASSAASDKKSASSAASDKKTNSAASSAKQSETTPAPSVSYTEKTMWKKLYLDWLEQTDLTNRKGFQLIQVDEDGIPELYVTGESQKNPPLLLWVKNGKLCQTELSPAGFQYIRSKNLFLNVMTADGKTTDVLQKLNGEKAETVASGEYSTQKGSSFYRWNGAEVSAEEYTAARDKLFDKNAARDVHKVKKLEDIRTALEQYKLYQ